MENKKLKEAILKILKQETEIVSIYNGGGDEPQQVAFSNSVGCDLEGFIENIADQILTEYKEGKSETELACDWWNGFDLSDKIDIALHYNIQKSVQNINVSEIVFLWKQQK